MPGGQAQSALAKLQRADQYGGHCNVTHCGAILGACCKRLISTEKNVTLAGLDWREYSAKRL
jgi:hypothetical protein